MKNIHALECHKTDLTTSLSVAMFQKKKKAELNCHSCDVSREWI